MAFVSTTLQFVFQEAFAMKLFWSLTAVLGFCGFGAGPAGGAELAAGDKAPDFSLVGSDGKTHKLSDYTGKQAIVIAWFPKAFTGG
jgi:peroxiredoxin Q/BCP